MDGRKRIEASPLSGTYAERVASLLSLIDVLDAEEAALASRIAARLAASDGYRAIQALPGNNLVTGLDTAPSFRDDNPVRGMREAVKG